MIDTRQFMQHIIVPALTAIDLDSAAAEELLLGTALQESGLRYLVQLGNGPAKGFFQMETATHNDIWDNYLRYRSELSAHIHVISSQQTAQEMVGNLLYAAAMCRVHYLRVSESLPKAGKHAEQAKYWKTHYNTTQGRGTEAEYIENWERGGL